MAFKNLLVHIDDGKACTDRIQAAIALAPASAAPRLPRPVHSEAFSMPADHGFRLHDHQHFTPIRQKPR